MNCPNCGAKNEADARFCAECGTPLDEQPDVVMSSPEEDESDQTILSSGPLVLEEAKTVSVTQDDVAAAAVEVEVETPPAPEPKSTPPADSPPPKGGAGGFGQGLTSQRNLIIIAIIVLVLLCCCCVTLGLLATAGRDVINDIMYELGMCPAQLLFI